MTIEPRRGTVYPAPYDQATNGRTKWSVTNALGLTRFGINVMELAPGAASSLRHWHSYEDEFVYVLEGEPTLITDEGEQILNAGDCAGFPAGAPNGHRFVNRTERVARFVEIGSRDDRDEVNYPDDDLHCTAGRYTKPAVLTKKDGTPFK
jgi:uncharacterized cupin superfamily protein